MKKNLATLMLCIIAFGFGAGINNKAMSDTDKYQIAYVDVNKLVLSSKVINQAQTKRDNQTKEMLKWYDSANSEIQKQQSQEEKQALIKKYENELIQKKKSIKDEYTKEIAKADMQMEDAITRKGKELGYTLVFKKDSLIYGADDITAKVLPLIK